MTARPRRTLPSPMRATLPSPTPAPTLRRRMRSGEASGRRAPSFGIAWLLLALACMVLALPGKAAPHRIGSAHAHSAVQAPAAERAAIAAESANDIAIAAPAADEGEPEALLAHCESSAEKESSGDKYRRAHGSGFTALAGLARTVPIAATSADGDTSTEGRLPPAHAPPATC